MRFFKHLGMLEFVAFATGFALLAYELVASRILAPSIGSSTYVWTSVIGVIIAALSLGYAFGGVLADRRVALHDIAWLLLGASLGMTMTLVFADNTLALLNQYIVDPRLQGLVASLLLFMPASFILGTISPYLARLRTHSVRSTGRSVASLSAFNAIGGICGTFCVGFLLFGYVGSQETLVITSLGLVVLSWFIAPQQHMRLRGLLSVMLIVITTLHLVRPPLPGVIADIDTPTARYQVLQDQNHQPVRRLIMGPNGSQSAIFVGQPDKLVFHYTKTMAQLVKAAPRKQSILMLGGGALTLPRYLAQTYPHAQIDVVEIDPQLTAIASHYFAFQPRPNLRVITQDARTFINTIKSQYDIVLVDVYHDSAVPFALTTVEYTAALERALQPDGAVIVNAIGALSQPCQKFVASLHGSYRQVFKDYRFLPQSTPNLQTLQNIIIVYANHQLEWAGGVKPHVPPGLRLTDDFAPVERLRLGCE